MTKLRTAAVAFSNSRPSNQDARQVLKMSQAKWLSTWREFITAGFGLIALLAAEWVLTSTIPGTQYSQGDGKVAQAVIHTALKFGGIFNLNNLNPLQGIGSQLQPHNVWANPAYWPLAVVDSPSALDVSALVALGCLALACYVMARCFDVPVLPSIVAAQLSIILFGPMANILVFYQVFWINPGIAVVYAPHLVALGIFARLRPGVKNFIFATGGIFALLLYSLICDPLWTLISGIGLLAAFAVVALSPLRVRPILVRCAALGSCLALLVGSGAIGYVYTLTQYSARVWFDALSYVPQPILASIIFISPKIAGTYYSICGLGWLVGILFAGGRVRVLAMAGLVSFVFVVAYGATFLATVKWWLPLPLYVEHSLFPLFTTAGIAGHWATLRKAYLGLLKVASTARRKSPVAALLCSRPASRIFHLQHPVLAGWLTALLVAAAIPVAVTTYAARAGLMTPRYNEPFPNEPGLLRFLEDTIGLRVGGEFRGSVTYVVSTDDATMYNLWMRGIPTSDEYSQLVTPQAQYLSAALFGNGVVLGGLNAFVTWARDSAYYDVLFKTLPAIGVRYIILQNHLAFADQRHLSSLTIPGRGTGGAPAHWILYELSNPNHGNYSPTEVVTAKSGADIITALGSPHFDFTKQVVLSTVIDEPLAPAHDTRLSIIRDGLHVSASSDGTSLLVLPQQFSHCLRARDTRVHLVRTNLLMTGVIFSGKIDTDILFDYGIFSSGCRRLDLAELKELIDRPRPTDKRIFLGWGEALARFRDAGVALQLVPPEIQVASVASGERPPSGPIVTTETVLSELPQPTSSGLEFIGIQGLNAQIEAGGPVVAGQQIIRLVAVPTTGRHYFAVRSAALNKDRVCRIEAWVKSPPGIRVEMQASDDLRPRGGAPANYGSAIFDPAARTVSSSAGLLKGRGTEPGSDGWQKIWVDLATASGECVVAFTLVIGDRSEFKGDGRLGLTVGGIEILERN